MFKKWYTACFKTYADVFIRLAAIYFALYLINLLTKNPDAFTINGRPLGLAETLFVILGILMFAKQFPDLLKDLLGIDLKGNFTLNPMKKVADIPIAGKLANTTIGGVQELVHGNGLRGFRNNWKNISWSGDKSKSVIDTNYRKLRQEMRQKQDPLRSRMEGTSEVGEMRKLWDEGDKARSTLIANGITNGKLEWKNSYNDYNLVYKHREFIDALKQKKTTEHWNEELQKELSISNSQMNANPNGNLVSDFQYHTASGDSMEIDHTTGEIWKLDSSGRRTGTRPVKTISTLNTAVYSEIKDEMTSSNGALKAAEAKLASVGKRRPDDKRTMDALNARKNPIRP